MKILDQFPALAPPVSVRVMHLVFDIKFVEKTLAINAAEMYGWCDASNLTIHLCQGLRPALLADTAIHELLHAIHFTAGMDDELDDETMAKQLSGPLVCVMRDNPEFFDWLRCLINSEI